METDQEPLHDGTGHEFEIAERRQIRRIEPRYGCPAGGRTTSRRVFGGTSRIHSDYSGVVH
jgi:hypothetical protein